MNPRAKYSCEEFSEWRWRHGECRWRRADKVAALRAEYDSAPVIPAIRVYPGSPQELRRCRELLGVLHEGPRRGRWYSPAWYFVDPAKWKQAEREAAEAADHRWRRRTSEERKKRFVEAILAAYPRMEREEAEKIAAEQFALLGVATSDLPLKERVRLAVRAHLRHSEGGI